MESSELVADLMKFAQVGQIKENTDHHATLSEDTFEKPADQAKLKGYLQQWTKAKCLLRCAFFVDLLIPISIFSKTLQNDDLTF